jgi:hypothetical protein
MEINVSEADAYHALRGNENWLGSDAEKLAALYRSSDYIRATYRTIDTDDADELVREATIRLAATIDNLATLRDGSRIKSEKESLDGVASTEVVYRDDAGALDPFPDITALLGPAFKPTSNGQGISVIRVVR